MRKPNFVAMTSDSRLRLLQKKAPEQVPRFVRAIDFGGVEEVASEFDVAMQNAQRFGIPSAGP